MNSAPLGVALFGSNAHQIHGILARHAKSPSPRARLVATAAFDWAKLPPDMPRDDVGRYASLDEILSDPRVDLVSLCSPRRADQAAQAIQCLEAGKHVYAEKPAVMSEADLDRVLETARRTGRHFREMAGTAFGQPYRAMRDLVRNGVIGEVVQVLADKSYGYRDTRWPDEDIDGGLLMQVGIHAARMIEHVAGRRIVSVDALQTRTGNPRGALPQDHLRMASALLMRLDNGGVATASANYFNQPSTGVWGYESLRIFGTLGIVESTEGGRRHHLYVGKEDRGPLDTSAGDLEYFDQYVESLLTGAPMPLTLEEELHPLRIVLRARESALANDEK